MTSPKVQSKGMSEPVVFLPLTQGYVAVVDFSDFDAVRAFKWSAKIRKRRVYAVRNERQQGKSTTIYLHQEILRGVSQVDHKDGDGLNNCRENLRPATKRQNGQGFQSKRAGTSKFRGVYWIPRLGKWAAKIKAEGKQLHLGCFSSEGLAAEAYDTAARRYFGEFASPNF